ncbi:hypothetical protein JL721_3464 [Aureococcus anophagefferens]|nr:hypothetical protein JL721_3464 [Aureococcus anophagefferens]
MGAAGSVEKTLQNVPNLLTKEQCGELASSHGVTVNERMFAILSNKEGLIPKPAVVRYCQLNAIAANPEVATPPRPAKPAPPGAKKDGREATGAANKFDANFVDADEERARRQKHAEALRMQAEEAMARFNELPLNEQKLAKNDGSLEMRAAARKRARRPSARPPELGRAGARPDASRAPVDAYAAFHKRLLGLFEVMGLDHPISEEEGRDLMEQDFELDSGGDGLVNEEKFLYSIFQLADQWTDSIDAEHYCSFLHKAYDIVYKEMIESDAIRPPAEWTAAMKAVPRSNAAWSNSKVVVEFMAEMYRLKIAPPAEGDAKPSKKAAQKARDATLCRFVLGEMAKRFGAADKRDGSGKQLQELTNTILAVIEKPPTMGGDKGGLQVFSWMLLFAQLVGFHTLSSRLVALPERAAVYVLDVIDKCRPLLDGKLPTNELRDCMAAKENEAMVGYIKVDKARVLMATLLKNAPFDTESAAFGQAMESAFRSIVLHIANTPCVEMAEFLTLVAAGFVATQCPTLVNEG